MDETFYSTKGRITSPKILIYDENWWNHFMIMKQQDTQGKLGHAMQYDSTIGGLDFVKNYIQGCRACQQFKIDWSPSKLAYITTEGAKSLQPFANCSMDLITDLPLADGFDSILVMVDQGLLDGVIMIPCNKTITSEDTAHLLLENLYKRFGLPDKIISDRGPA